MNTQQEINRIYKEALDNFKDLPSMRFMSN